MTEGNQLLSELSSSDFDRNTWVVQQLKRLTRSELGEMAQQLQRQEKKINAASDALIMRNLKGIVDEGYQIQQSLDSQKEHAHLFESAEHKMDMLNDIFLEKYAKAEKAAIQLRNIREMSSLVSNYQKLIKWKLKLNEGLAKFGDMELLSESYSRCVQLIRTNDFSQLKGFERAKDEIEAARKIIISECETKIWRCLETQNVVECRGYLSALDNVGSLQSKVQELTNKLLRENFNELKSLLTETVEEEESTIIKELQSFKEKMKNVILGTILDNSIKMWVLETSIFERKCSVKDKELSKLFQLYFRKMESILVQTVNKLIESKAKFKKNHSMLFFNSPAFLAALQTLSEKLYMFIATMHNGAFANLLSLADIQFIYKNELESLVVKEFGSLRSWQQTVDQEVFDLLLESLTNRTDALLGEEVANGLQVFLELHLHMLLVPHPLNQATLNYLCSAVEGLLSKTMKRVSESEQNEEEEHRNSSASAETLSIHWKIVSCLSQVSEFLTRLIDSCGPAIDANQIASLLNTLYSFKATFVKKLIDSGANFIRRGPNDQAGLKAKPRGLCHLAQDPRLKSVLKKLAQFRGPLSENYKTFSLHMLIISVGQSRGLKDWQHRPLAKDEAGQLEELRQLASGLQEENELFPLCKEFGGGPAATNC